MYSNFSKHAGEICHCWLRLLRGDVLISRHINGCKVGPHWSHISCAQNHFTSSSSLFLAPLISPCGTYLNHRFITSESQTKEYSTISSSINVQILQMLKPFSLACCVSMQGILMWRTYKICNLGPVLAQVQVRFSITLHLIYHCATSEGKTVGF